MNIAALRSNRRKLLIMGVLVLLCAAAYLLGHPISLEK